MKRIVNYEIIRKKYDMEPAVLLIVLSLLCPSLCYGITSFLRIFFMFSLKNFKMLIYRDVYDVH